MDNYTIALYIRLSLEDTKTESMSIENQKLILRQHAQTLKEGRDAKILEFVDNGYTGTNFDRPAVQELLRHVQNGRVDCIIVKDFSRFGRNSLETGYLIEQVLPLFRTRFISVEDNFDTINYKEDTGGMEIAFKYLINEYYSKDLSKKSKSAKYAKMKNGTYQSILCCYGYKKGANGRLEIDEEPAKVVQMIFDMALSGIPTSKIVKALYDKGIPTPGEYKVNNKSANYDISRCRSIWQRSAILRILDDERYIGTYIIGKRTVTELGSKHVRLKDEKEWYKISDHHPAIIDKAVFEQVKAQKFTFKIDKKPHDYTLRGKVICGCCNHSMTRHKKPTIFECRFTQVDETAECHGLTISEIELETMIFDILSKQAEIIHNSDNKNYIAELNSQYSQKSQYENLIKSYEDKKCKLYERYFLKEISLDDYTELKSSYDSKLQDLKPIYLSISAETEKKQMESEARSAMTKMSTDISKENALTQELANMLLDKVFICPDNKIEIMWTTADFCNENIY